jgi:hypothetical protein
MPISLYLYIGLFILVMATGMLIMGSLFIWSLIQIWCLLNSDIVERNRRMRKYRKRSFK